MVPIEQLRKLNEKAKRYILEDVEDLAASLQRDGFDRETAEREALRLVWFARYGSRPAANV